MRYRFVPLLAAAIAMASAGPAPAGGLDPVTRATVAIDCRVAGSPGGFVGTGMVVHELGYILTSTTVVPPGAVDIHCRFVGPRSLPARLVVADEKLELAVVKVDPPKDGPPLSVLTLGDSRSIKVGQTVFTVGDAYTAFRRSGRFTVSLGILSGAYELTRQIAPQPVYVGRVLETTATVAPGMDGGPLLDGAGRLIGMLSLNVSDARWMGVAVPVDALRARLEETIAADAKDKLGLKGEDVALSIGAGRGQPVFPAQEKLDEAFRESAERVAASVVAIEVDRKSERRPSSQPASTRPAQPPRRPPRPRPRADASAYRDFFVRPKALVTGVVATSRGHILTSYYNVWGELNSIHVILPDGQRVPAKLLGYDEAQDLAMLKVEARGLAPIGFPAVTPTLSTQIATVGRSPDPQSITMTRGIISAVGRLNGSAIQIDAETNYANSGAPVIDVNGNCLGIVTHVRPDSLWGQNSGIGFATTAAVIRQDLNAMIAGRAVDKPKRGFLGVVMGQGRIDVTGIVIEQVQDNGPADRAGLQAKDIVTHIDGKPVADAADLSNLITARKPGQTVRLTVRRGSRTMTLDVVLGEHPYQ